MTRFTMLRLSAALAFGGLVASALPVQAAEQALVQDQSEIVFVSTQMGVAVEGRFKTFDAQLAFDPARLDSSQIAMTVDLASATLGSPESDAELRKPAWFNVSKFPQATFRSSAIKAMGEGKFEVAGKLSIKGVSHDVIVPVTLERAGALTMVSGGMPIKRLDFKIGEEEWADTSLVADGVQVKFKFALSGVAQP